MRTPVCSMVHPLPKVETHFEKMLSVSVGEWVEVAFDYSPGMCSAGGIAVVKAVEDGNLINVKYVLDGRSEKFITIDRLTTIVMPYRRENATLRPRSSSRPSTAAQTMEQNVFRQLNEVERLYKGLAMGLHKKTVILQHVIGHK